MVCPACGRENDADARFCASCGDEPRPRPAGRGAQGRHRPLHRRRRVDGARRAARPRARCAASCGGTSRRCRASLERHGGTVEKFIGDAVMAVFGVPAVREDDRAPRRSRGGRDRRRARGLNDELAREHGVEIVTRTGVNTGEVIVGGGAPDQKLATGDAVNVAARLEQAAAPGEVLLGEATYAAVADLVHAEPAPPVEAKGKSAAARRLPARSACGRTCRRSRARSRRRSSGGATSSAALRAAFDDAVASRSATLATIVGTPGIGKSRLARELLGSLADEARVSIGRCASYGEGVAVPPARRRRRATPATSTGTRGAIERGDSRRGGRRRGRRARRRRLARRDRLGVPAAVRDARARARRSSLVVDDIHWAEPALLDLSSTSPASRAARRSSLLCTARPDLFDVRPVLGGAARARDARRARAARPRRLGRARRRRSRSELAPELRERIVATAEGNPLFVEQLLAHFARRSRTPTTRPADDPGAARRAHRPARARRSARSSSAARSRAGSSTAAPSPSCSTARPSVGGTLLAPARARSSCAPTARCSRATTASASTTC